MFRFGDAPDTVNMIQIYKERTGVEHVCTRSGKNGKRGGAETRGGKRKRNKRTSER